MGKYIPSVFAQNQLFFAVISEDIEIEKHRETKDFGLFFDLKKISVEKYGLKEINIGCCNVICLLFEIRESKQSL